MMHGFTCGIKDLLLVQPYEEQRKKLLDACLDSGKEVHQQFIGREKEHLGMLYFFIVELLSSFTQQVYVSFLSVCTFSVEENLSVCPILLPLKDCPSFDYLIQLLFFVLITIEFELGMLFIQS